MTKNFSRGHSWAAAPMLVLASAAAVAQEKPADEWHWSLAPYLWVISLDGQNQTHDSGNDIDRPISLDLDAAISGLEFGLLGHLEARKSNWGWFVDFAYVELEIESNIGPLVLDDIGFDGLETEVAAIYRPGGPKGTFDVFAGLRYWDLSLEVPITASLSYTEDVSWTDLMAGARYTPRLSEKWGLSLRADVAGSSDGSDLTLNLEALAGWNVFKNGVFIFGWRYMDVKFAEGNADDVNDESYHELDITFSGPIVSYQFNW